MADSSILFEVNWSEVFKSVGSTAVIVTALGFIARSTINNFFQRDIESYKARLKEETDCELAASKKRADAELLAQKTEFDRQMKMFEADLDTTTARAERIRQEVVRWANPILESVIVLQERLDNILNKAGYLALSPDCRASGHWSIRYDYFFPSTVYIFSRYFCWVRLLEERMSFELFEEHFQKDRFFEKIRSVRHKLSKYPLDELDDAHSQNDRQIFSLEQQALGEVMIVSDNNELRCMRYNEFLDKWSDETIKKRFSSIAEFIDRLEPDNGRWKRLELMRDALKQLHEECRRLLTTSPQ
jgi:hypothetical protein